jgi:hypothetical protein
MKTLLTILVCLSLLSNLYAQEAKVNKLQGKYVFYFNEPAREYDVVFSFKSDPISTCPTLDGLIEISMKSAMLEAGAQGRQFDAIIIGTAERDMAIKFKDPALDNSVATVKRNNGKYYYIFCEPSGEYSVVEKIKAFRANQITGQCLSTTQLVEKVMKDALKSEKKNPFNGIIIGNDQLHNSITLK